MTPKEIKALREKFKMNQEQFARLIGKNQLTVYRWETGKTSPTKNQIIQLEALADAAEKFRDEKGNINEDFMKALKGSALFPFGTAVGTALGSVLPFFSPLSLASLAGGTALTRMMKKSKQNRETGKDPSERLKKLIELHKDGLITDSEFEMKKKEILDGI